MTSGVLSAVSTKSYCLVRIHLHLRDGVFTEENNEKSLQEPLYWQTPRTLSQTGFLKLWAKLQSTHRQHSVSHHTDLSEQHCCLPSVGFEKSDAAYDGTELRILLALWSAKVNALSCMTLQWINTTVNKGLLMIFSLLSIMNKMIFSYRWKISQLRTEGMNWKMLKARQLWPVLYTNYAVFLVASIWKLDQSISCNPNTISLNTSPQAGSAILSSAGKRVRDPGHKEGWWPPTYRETAMLSIHVYLMSSGGTDSAWKQQPPMGWIWFVIVAVSEQSNEPVIFF